MTTVFLAAGLVTFVLLLVLDGLRVARSDPRRWIVARTRLLPGVVLATVVALAAGAVPEAALGRFPALAWSAPVAVAGLFLLVLSAYRRGGE